MITLITPSLRKRVQPNFGERTLSNLNWF